MEKNGNSFVVGFRRLAGSSYSLQWKGSLNVGAWNRVTNINPQATTGWQQVTNSFLPTTNRFYRLVSPAQ